MSHTDLQCFFHPSSVAVIGASDSAEKLGHTILKNLVEGGFSGALYPVNPGSDRIQGLTCFHSVAEIPDHVDLAVIVIPAKFVPQAVRECGEKGIKGVVIVSGGFSEAGPEGEALQQQVVEAAREFGVRVIGPNCQGVNNPYHPLCASWPLLTHRGRVAVISQSGTVGAAMMDWFSHEELGVSSFVSLGNRADVDTIDLIEYFENDPNTKVIASYIEGVKGADRFRRVLESLTKPLVVLKSGRTPRGRIAAESHTKSLAGADAVYSSLFRHYGVHRAETLEDFYDSAKALAYLTPPAGNRVLFITTSGGSAILATDAAEKEGLDVAPLPDELTGLLHGVIPPHASWTNPLDLTGDADAKMFAEVIQRARPFYDTLGVIFGDPVVDASTVVTPDSNELVIFLGGADVERVERIRMHQNGVPVFPSPERGIRALARLIPAAKRGIRASNTFPTASGRRQMSLYESLKFIEGKGFDCIAGRSAESPGKAVHIAHQMGFPVCLKIDSPDILHKSDCGGVRLNIQSAQYARTAYAEMMEQVTTAHPEAKINGVVVSAMAAPGVELIFGMNRDPQFGPVILFGLGGVAVELFRDIAVRLLPLSREDAESMVDEIRGAPLLKGYRGSRTVDRAAVVDGLLRLARIAEEHGDIVGIDLNPVYAYPEGIVVADARVIRA